MKTASNSCVISHDTAPVELLAVTLVGMRALGVRNRDVVRDFLRATLEGRPECVAIWAVWETDAFDARDHAFRNAEGHDARGRFVPYWHRANGSLALETLRGYEGPGTGDWYSFVRRHRQICAISEPMRYSIGGREHWITSEMAPLMDQGLFLGSVGFDYPAHPTTRRDASTALPRVLAGSMDRLRLLSAREREVHFWLCKGKSNDEIALVLGISPHTVKNHLSMIFQKLGVENRFAAALLQN